MPHTRQSMRVPQFGNFDLLQVNNAIAKGSSVSGRKRVSNQNSDRLGRTYSPYSLETADNQGKSGILGKKAIPISRAIAALQQKYLADIAARKKEKEAVLQRKEAILEAYRLRNQSPQNAGYKKTKATTKATTKPKKK